MPLEYHIIASDAFIGDGCEIGNSHTWKAEPGSETVAALATRYHIGRIGAWRRSADFCSYRNWA